MTEQKSDIEELLSQGYIVQIKPQGYSMYPMFVPGRDEARIAPPGSHRLKRGDVVLYRRPGSILVLHRIVRKNASGIYLTGDNQKDVEGPVSQEQVRGVLTGFVRNGEYTPVTNPLYRFCAFFWLLLRPVRPVISETAARIKRALRIGHE